MNHKRFKTMILFVALVAITIPSCKSIQQTSRIISVEDASAMVLDLPEVQGFFRHFSEPGGTSPITGGTPHIEYLGTKDDEYWFRVFEDIPTHTVSFNFYYVNPASGKIRREFDY